MQAYYTSFYHSPLGNITLASDGSSLIGLWFDGQKYFADSIAGKKTQNDEMLPVFADTCHWLDIYFSGKQPDFIPPLKMLSTPFRKAVWEILLTIPYGKTITYGEIATIIATQKNIAKMSAQAVGGAVGHNNISIIIPCHRVIGTHGSLTGYAGGINKKILLLEHEGIDISRLTLPIG